MTSINWSKSSNNEMKLLLPSAYLTPIRRSLLSQFSNIIIGDSRSCLGHELELEMERGTTVHRKMCYFDDSHRRPINKSKAIVSFAAFSCVFYSRFVVSLVNVFVKATVMRCTSMTLNWTLIHLLSLLILLLYCAWKFALSASHMFFAICLWLWYL